MVSKKAIKENLVDINMPAKSKQQQKFFGVVKAMQKGDIPKKGEAGKVAKSFKSSKKDSLKFLFSSGGNVTLEPPGDPVNRFANKPI